MPALQTEDLTLCEPLALELELRRDVDHNEVFAALVALGDDILDMLPIIYQERPDTLQRRLVAWGFGFARYEDNRHRLGIYGDYTAGEHDAIVLPALAPFMEDDCRYIYQERATGELRGWYFENGGVTLREVEQVVDYLRGQAI